MKTTTTKRNFRYGQPTLTVEQFDSMADSPEFDGFQRGTLAAARRALVDGERPADIASELGITTQAVYAACKRFFRAAEEAEEGLDRELELVPVQIPPERRDELESFVESIGGKC